MSLSTVVSNLVTNAIKYNRAGGCVAVRAAHEGAVATIEVTDTGIGIPADSLPRVFDEFYRVDAVKAGGIPGSGLGLAICRGIVTELGGSIGVTSKLGVGSTFTVRLPAAETKAGSDVSKPAAIATS